MHWRQIIYRLIIAAFLLSFPAGCAVHDRGVIASTSPFPGLKGEIDAQIAHELYPYTVAAIKVVSLATGEALYETNPRLLLSPASNEKLFVAAAALSLLGPEHPLVTSAALDGSAIYLKGGGDPLLTAADLATLARQVAARLPAGGVSYAVIADTSCFDAVWWGAGWLWDDEPDPDEMFISALSVEGNAVTVAARPGEAPSAPLAVTTYPPTGYPVIVNTATTGNMGGSCEAEISRPPGDRENRVTVSGSLAPGCAPVAKRLSLWKPERYALHLFADALAREGVRVTSLGEAATPPGATTVARISRPLGNAVTVMLKESDNLCAENVLKYLGHVKKGGEGSAASGITVLKEYLEAVGIPSADLLFADGSGVSHYNLNNADTIVRLLQRVSSDPSIARAFADALPVAGRDGTLAARMKKTPAEGKVRAKTGTILGVSSLSGYLVTGEGEPVAFSMLMENFTGAPERVRDLQDRIAVLLSTFRRSGQ